MSYLSIFVFAFVLVSSPVFAAEPRTPRPLDAISIDAFERAQAQSATVRSLVSTLESSNVIVHIVSSRTLPMGIGGITQFVTSRGGYRYVRITLAANMWESARAAILAHELQHACEIATSGADDLDSVKQLFEKAGHHDGNFYETQAAIDTERQAQSEVNAARMAVRLRSRQALQAEPVVKFNH